MKTLRNKNLLVTLSHESPGNTGKLRGRIAKTILGLTKENEM